jgi:hypothetical protein
MAVERLAASRNAGQQYSCHEVERRDLEYDPFPDVPAHVPVLEVDRILQIIADTDLPTESEIRLGDVPPAIRRRRRVGDPWYVVEAFLIVQ